MYETSCLKNIISLLSVILSDTGDEVGAGMPDILKVALEKLSSEIVEGK